MVTFILLGLAVWIATSTIVEAEIFRDVREAVDRLHAKAYKEFNQWRCTDVKWTDKAFRRYQLRVWLAYKLKYLIGCHLCAGIWVAAIVALFVPPVASSGIVGWGLTALAIKGIAHLFLVVQKLAESRTDWLRNDSILNAYGPNENHVSSDEEFEDFKRRHAQI